MAWNPEPSIAHLRDFGKKFDRPVVVTFSLDSDGNRFHIDTYGKTRQLCKLAGEFGSEIAKAVKEGVISPPEIEPKNPCQSSVWVRQNTLTMKEQE